MLSDFQKRKLTVLFHYYDGNGDGVLTQADYEGFARRTCELWHYPPGTPKFQTAHTQNIAVWEFMQSVADKDRDARISLGEFVAAYDAMLADAALYERLVVGYGTTVLRLSDGDGDGKVSSAEYVGLLGCYGVPQGAAQEAFRHLDRDGNGYLTIKEVLKRLMEYYGDDPEAPGNWLFGPF